MYIVQLKPTAQKFIEAQPKKIQKQIIRRIESLAVDPHPENSKLLYAKEKVYSFRSGDYRIIYQLQEKTRIVVIAKIGHRKDVYNRLTN